MSHSHCWMPLSSLVLVALLLGSLLAAHPASAHGSSHGGHQHADLAPGQQGGQQPGPQQQQQQQHEEGERAPHPVSCGHQLVSEESRRWSEAHRRWRDATRAAAAAKQQQQPPAPGAAGGRPAQRLLAEGGAPTPLPAPGTRPIRIWVEYQYTDIDGEVESKLKDTVNVALGVLQKYFRVRSPPGGAFLAPALCVVFDSAGYCDQYQPDFVGLGANNKKLSSCGLAAMNASHIAPYRQCQLGGSQCVDYRGGTGEHTDYYLYITTQQDKHCDSGAVAWALPCLYDTTTNRPVLGSANICPNNLAAAEADAAVAVLVHELLHALGFTDDSFDKFVDEDGEPIPKDRVVREITDPYGRRTSVVVSPTVVREAQAQFGCSSIPGAALENEGGQGSANAHWEYRWFQGELMVATNLFAVYGKPATMSRITLAFMQDSGWYDVNWDAAGFLDWGYQAGCGFVLDTCDGYARSHPDQQYFCSKEDWAVTTNSVCTFDGLARAKCEDAQFADGCIMKMALYASPNCLSPQHATSAGDKFGWSSGLGSRCTPVTWLFNNYDYQFPESSFKQGWKDSVCYSSTCSEQGILQLNLFDQKVECPTGKMVDLAKAMPQRFKQGLIGPCPNNTAVCAGLACRGACDVGGVCVSGKCHCNLQFTGDSCEKRLTPSGDYTKYDPAPGNVTPAAQATGYLMLSIELDNSQDQLLSGLDRFKTAVAQLAGVTTARVAVLSFASNRPASSIWGGAPVAAGKDTYARRRLSEVPDGAMDGGNGGDGPAALSGAFAGLSINVDVGSGGGDDDEGAAAALAGAAGAGGMVSSGWFPPPEEGGSGSAAEPDAAGSGGGLGGGEGAAASAAQDAAAPRLPALLSRAAEAVSRLSRRRLTQACPGGCERLQVFSRVATMGPQDAEAVASRIGNASRQEAFSKALAASGLSLVAGSISVQLPSEMGAAGSVLGITDPNTMRAVVIAVVVVAAVAVAAAGGCCLLRYCRPRAGAKRGWGAGSQFGSAAAVWPSWLRGGAAPAQGGGGGGAGGWRGRLPTTSLGGAPPGGGGRAGAVSAGGGSYYEFGNPAFGGHSRSNSYGTPWAPPSSGGAPPPGYPFGATAQQLQAPPPAAAAPPPTAAVVASPRSARGGGAASAGSPTRRRGATAAASPRTKRGARGSSASSGKGGGAAAGARDSTGSGGSADTGAVHSEGGRYVVQGRSFATRHEAEEHALSVAIERSLREARR